MPGAALPAAATPSSVPENASNLPTSSILVHPRVEVPACFPTEDSMSLTSVQLRLCPRSLMPAVTRSLLNLVFTVETVTIDRRDGDLYFMEMEEGKESKGGVKMEGA